MPKKRQIDRWLLGATLVTAVFGVVMVASASGPLREWDFAFRQFIAVLVGSGLLVAAMFVPLEHLVRWRWASLFLFGTWLALVIVLFQRPINGARRWLQVGGASIQPSALAKIALPLALAAWLAHARQERLSPRRTWGVALTLATVTCGLVFFEPDLGSAVLLGTVAVIVLLLADMPWKPLALAGGGALIVMALGIALTPYRAERVRDFFGKTSFQIHQSLIALGDGGLFGRGLGGSLQKLFYLPQPHSDFIFAIVGEELGFIGALIALVAIGVIVWRGMRIAARAQNFTAALLASGLAAALAAQTLLNVSVCLKLIPAKGLPLPLLSAGGSDVVVTLVAIGLLLNVGKEYA